MSTSHRGGNIQNEITLEEHDGTNNAKRVNVVAGGVGQATVNINGSVTINAVVNTGAASDPNIFIGLTTSVIGNTPTVFVGTPTLYAVVNTSAPGVSNSIVTVANTPLDTQIVGNVSISSNTAWPDPKTYIGLVTVANTVPVTFSGNVTIDSGSVAVTSLPATPVGSSTIGIVRLAEGTARTITGNVTLSDSRTYIGLVTSRSVGLTTVVQTGNTTVIQANSARTITGNLTLSDAKTFIGLTTTILGNNSVQAFGQFYPTLQSVASGGLGPIALDQFGRVRTTNTGNITIDSGNLSILGNLTLSDSKTGIGLVSIFGGNINTVTAVTDITNPVAIKGNITLSDSKTFVGLVSVSGFANPLPVDATGQGDVPITLAGEQIVLGTGANFVGIVTIANPSSFTGNVTLDAGSKTQIVGNLTLSDPKTYIGLTTTWIGGGATVFAVVNTSAAGQSSVVLDRGHQFIGLATVVQSDSTRSIIGNLTLSDPKGFIGLVTVVGSLSPAAGNVTLDPGSFTGIKGNLTIDSGNISITNTPTVFVGTPTLFAVVNTSAPGVGNSIVTVANTPLDTSIIGNVTLSDSKGFIGLVSVSGFANPLPVTFSGNVTLSDAKTYIGLVTATLAGSNATIAPFGKFLSSLSLTSIDSGSFGPIMVDNFGRQVLGNPNTYIGLVTADVGTIKAWSNPNTYIGLVTVDIGSSKTISVAGNVTLSDSKTFIGLTTTTLGASPAFVGIVTIANTNIRSIAGNVTLSDARTYIGLNTVTAGVGDRFIGLVTAWVSGIAGNLTIVDAGTTKTPLTLPVGLGNNSLSTVVVPTNNNRIKITNLVLSSNVTTSVVIKSGVTTLTGNASLAVTIFPGGGFVLPGDVNSPSWIGLPSGSLNFEKRDSGGTVANLTGHVTYLNET